MTLDKEDMMPDARTAAFDDAQLHLSEEFDNDSQMRPLLDKLKALRDERLVFGGDNE